MNIQHISTTASRTPFEGNVIRNPLMSDHKQPSDHTLEKSSLSCQFFCKNDIQQLQEGQRYPPDNTECLCSVLIIVNRKSQ